MNVELLGQVGMTGEAADPSTVDLGPTEPEGPDPVIDEIYNKFDLYRRVRRPYEIQWYINTSALRGFPDVRWNSEEDRLEIKREPPHRKRYRINYIKTKTIARVAKYTRSAPNPSVVPGTTDREDIFNARASQKALEYITKKAHIRERFMQVMQAVPVTGKAFMAVRWDDKVIGASPSKNVETSEIAPTLGEVCVDFCPAFELLVPDPGIEDIGLQPDVIRAKLILLKDIKARYGAAAADVQGESKDADVFFYQRQIADLGSRQSGMASGISTYGEGEKEDKKYTLRLEYFVKPCADYPQGRYVVVANRVKLWDVPNLPGNFMAITEHNPYPFVEFCDDKAPGQFYPDAFVERMIDLQREYNEYRSKVAESLTMHMFPKLVVYNQHGLDENAFNTEAGERLNINGIPGLADPHYLQAPNVAGDAWNAIQHIKNEFDDVTSIYPASTGGAKGQNSGYQTSLLQEAADQVHGPAIQRNAYALEELFLKVRHLMKLFYTIPRLITIAGRNNIPEVFEFSQDSIDENADIRIEPDTMMPPLRSVRLDQIRQWAETGLYGNIQDPNVLKKIHDAARMNGFVDPYQDQLHRDEEEAQEENIRMNRGEELSKPQPWENHMSHWELHVDEFKSPEAKLWPPDQWQRNVLHALVHLNYINPQQALMMAGEFGLQGPLFQLLQMQQFAAQQATQGLGIGPQGQPPQAPPQGQVPNGRENQNEQGQAPPQNSPQQQAGPPTTPPGPPQNLQN